MKIQQWKKVVQSSNQTLNTHRQVAKYYTADRCIFVCVCVCVCASVCVCMCIWGVGGGGGKQSVRSEMIHYWISISHFLPPLPPLLYPPSFPLLFPSLPLSLLPSMPPCPLLMLFPFGWKRVFQSLSNTRGFQSIFLDFFYNQKFQPFIHFLYIHFFWGGGEWEGL